MPQYLLSVIHPYTLADVAEMDMSAMGPVFEAVDAFNTRLTEAGQWVFAGGLTPVDDARVARTGDGGTVTDGPYLETKEHLGGFWIVDVPADQIDEVALAAAQACAKDVEIRTLQPEPDED